MKLIELFWKDSKGDIWFSAVIVLLVRSSRFPNITPLTDGTLCFTRPVILGNTFAKTYPSSPA